ncbi:PR domain zinc finger protein 8 [Xyrauchen texanus]|uniref:PR domain zinc finger protein 8 n=1 Tax=Xyrauchen texanus TaxID=154827 RepID=UPI002241F23A|nr:PR domain zinc finger protein 8 [Xyrauchen texanus]
MDAVAAKRWITDLLSSIHTSRAIPAGAVFGPCALKHTSLCDSIAFIALKCSDRRTASYMLQVDTTAPSECLNLIQSARNAEEQNLEAYMKNGHLFFKALKEIPENTELLAWYGRDLAKLLGLNSEQKNTKDFICSECKQSFLFEFPLLAHQRFFCTEKPTNQNSSRKKLIKPEINLLIGKPSTDFHNLARELENCKKNLPVDARTSSTKRRRSFESGTDESDGEPSSFDTHGDEKLSVKRFCVNRLNGKSWSPSSNQSFSKGQNSQCSQTKCHDDHSANPDGQELKSSTIVTKLSSPTKGLQDVTGDIISSNQERKSAFTQPPRVMSHIPLVMSARLTSDLIPTRTTLLPTILPLTSPPVLNFQSSALLHRDLPKPLALLHSTKLWPKTSRLLPPSITSIGLPMQNWCAKCNISFHMTTDLVQHMRSHHKRRLSDERKRTHREERLKCPICNEAFRERHHLSRHMTSHT